MPPSAVWNEADLVADGAREAALLVAEELALHELGRDRAAVDRHERPFAPRPGVVNHARDELLAGARFARDVHGSLAPRDLGDHRAHALERRRLADETVGRGAARNGGAFELQGRRHELAQIVQVERLRHEVERAELQRADGRFDAAVRRDHGDRRAGHLALNPLDELEPVAIGKPHVGEAQVECLLAERLLGAS